MDSLDKLQNLYKATKVENPWAVARAIVDGTSKNPLYDEKVKGLKSEKDKKSLMGKIVAGIEGNPWNKKSIDSVGDVEGLIQNSYAPENADEQHKTSPKHRPFKEWVSKKMSPALAALGGWWLGGEIAEMANRQSQPTPAQQREFERQVRQAMRRGMKKDATMDELKTHFKDSSDTYIRRNTPKNGVDVQKQETTVLSKILPTAPKPGMIFNVVSRRWQKPENAGQEVVVRGGKKRIRGTGTGIHERSISGHGKGRVRGEAKGRVGRGETDIATKEKRGTIHGKSEAEKVAERAAKRHKKS